MLLGATALAGGALGIALGRRGKPGDHPRIAEVMTRHPACIAADASAQVAARRMAEEGVGALAVCDDRGRPVGVLTDRDLVVRLLAHAEDPREITVGQCQEGELATVEEDATLEVAASEMRANAVRRLPVVRDGHLVGIISHADVALHDPATGASVARDLTRAPSDLRSAAWLFRQPYREQPEV